MIANKHKLKFYPENTIEKLEFDEILNIASKYSMGDLGRKLVLNTNVSSDYEWIEKELRLSEEILNTGINDEHIPIESYNDITEDLYLLSKDGYVLSIESIKNIFFLLNAYNSLLSYFNDERKIKYPLLEELIVDFDECNVVLNYIHVIFNSDFIVKDNASPELASIRRVLKRKLKEIDSAFAKSINTYISKGYLKDTVESYRNGRRVLSVKAEHKRMIKGVIHDDSATGKTVFIEPQEVLQLNYDLFDLQLEERNEIRKIIGVLCQQLRPFSDEILTLLKIVARLDCLNAKVRFSKMIDGVKPNLFDGPLFEIKHALHPLLLLKNKEISEKTIAFDLHLKNNNKLLVISGPNAGGKSVTLKSVGLLQVMVQAGFLVSVNEDTVFGVFDKIFTDIGDQQSIEKDLSTYSSRLINHKKVLLHSTPRSLVLIDEFGSGTDPQIGGSMAEAVLNQLVGKEVFGVITTHYSNLKIFAHKTKGIVNGAMSFDRNTLMPTYNLLLGKPGSSYAFEIAERIGLPKKIIKYAQNNSGKNVKDVEDVLTDLRSNLISTNVKQEKLVEKEKQLDSMIKVYESLFSELEIKRRRLKTKQKETNLFEVNKLKLELKDALRDIKNIKSVEKAENLRKKLKDESQTLSIDLVNIKEEIESKINRVEPTLGDHVQLINGGAKGQIISIRKNKAVVEMGMMKMEIPLLDLDVINPPVSNNFKKGISVKLSSSSSLQNSKLDIRGMLATEAMSVLEDFFDNNLLSDNRVLEIIHGKGTGVLRNLVKTKIKEYGFEAKVYHPSPKSGGNGKTIIEFL